MFVAMLMSFLACISACLAVFLSNPIDTNVVMDSSGGSAVKTGGAIGLFLCTSRPVKEGTFPMTFLLDVVGGVIPGEGKESREKNEAMNAGNFILRMRRMLRRYKEPARIPHIPGRIDLFQDENRSCRQAKYMKDLSEMLTPNMRNRVETGMSK